MAYIIVRSESKIVVIPVEDPSTGKAIVRVTFSTREGFGSLPALETERVLGAISSR